MVVAVHDGGVQVDLRGLWVPAVTPFDPEDGVDLPSLDRLCRRLVHQGVRGLVALGTTGEPAVLDESERRAVIEAMAQLSAELASPLMVGVGTNDTRRTVAAVEALAGLEAVTAALVVVPYYTRPSGPAVVEHYRVVAAHSPVPIVAYNVPYRTGRGLDAEELLQIAEIDNVAGLKQAVGSLDTDTLRMLRDAPSDFAVLAGDDAFIAPTIAMGGGGAIAAAAHLCTEHFAALVDAALAGEATRARALAAALLPVVSAGFAEPNPAGWKAALHHFGELRTAALRAPMAAASAAGTAALVAAVHEAQRRLLPVGVPPPPSTAALDEGLR